MTDSLQEKFRLERITEISDNPHAPFFLKATCQDCMTAFDVDLRREQLKERLEGHTESCSGKNSKAKIARR